MSASAASSGSSREFKFSRQDFERVRKLIHAHAGISLSEGKQDMVYSRLARRLRATGVPNFTDYMERLESGDPEELEAFTNSLTTNLTSFFREPHHFPLLADHISGIADKRPITIWCCAASTGEEPYSIAMTVIETFGSFTPAVKILATDVDTNVLMQGQQGVYAMDRLEKMPQEQVKRFFQKGVGAKSGHARVRPEVRHLITFRQLNLLDDRWPVSGPFDAIFCRNVMIYFDKPTQYKVLAGFVPLLRPDGLLFAGHSESFTHATDLFRLRGKTVLELAKKRQST
jgi:chemotaxis protein methyltransferase CheR